MTTPSEQSSDVKFEIGHVLFIDIVGYSKLLINEQSEQIQRLKQIVRGTEQFRLAEADGKLLRLPTGDGGALVFRTSSEAPVLCALEVAKALKEHPQIRVRMGIHSGPVNEISDLNEQANIAGAGINIAQRIMDCGDAGHILLSRHVAEDLEHYPRWQPNLHPLGECEVKHGLVMSVVNFYQDELGNPAVPQKFAKGPSTTGATARPKNSGLCLRHWIIGILTGTAVVFGILFFLKQHRMVARPGSNNATNEPAVATSAIPDKSIAVLPFDNLSRDPDNAYFCEGVQDEILTRLAKVADLKVISRTSTQHFKSTPDNLPQIAKQLGVAHIVEGSVQKANDQVRVNVQLINALTDAHLWADTYDRKLTDIFAVESDIAKTIAETLKAKLTGSEQTEMTKKPTANPEAYQLYLQGRFFWNKRTAADLRKSIDYFNQAIANDPNYALAYAATAQSWLVLPAYDGGAPNECFPKAEHAARTALGIEPTLSDALTALGGIKSCLSFDLTGAIADFERAIELNPNDSTAHHWLGNHPLTCLGQLDKALAEIRRAQELDPLSLIINSNIGYTLTLLGRYDEAIAQFHKTLDLDPNFYYARYNLGLALELKGSTPEAIGEFQKAAALSEDLASLGFLGHLYGKIGRRAEAQQILNRLLEIRKQRYTEAYFIGLVYLGLGDRDEALRYFQESYEDRDGYNIGPIRVDPLLNELHGDARFEALAEKIVPARSSAVAAKHER